MQYFKRLEKPRASALAAVHAEYHRLAGQQLELFKLTLQFQRLPDAIQLLIVEKHSVHRRSVRYYEARSKFMLPAPVTSSLGVGLASMQASGVHPFSTGNSTALMCSFL